jgi:spermidine synthase
MADLSSLTALSGASLWINNLVDGTSGMAVKAKHSIFSGSSHFQKIEVFDTYAYGRILMLAGTLMFTERDEFIYHEMMSHPALSRHPNPKSVCIIGGGDGGVLREVLKHPTIEKVVVVDIDDMVKQTIETYFHHLATGFSDKRAEVVIKDGVDFFLACKDTFDIIIVDSYDPGGPVQSLETEDFFSQVASHVAPEGCAVFQSDSPILRPGFVRSIHGLVKPHFAAMAPYICSIPSFPAGTCSFILAAHSNDFFSACNSKATTTIAPLCKYYTEAIHTAAFVLPRYLQQIYPV